MTTLPCPEPCRLPPRKKHSVPSRAKLCTASGSEGQLHPARRPRLSSSHGHHQEQSQLPWLPGSDDIHTHTLAGQCDQSQQQRPCHVPSHTQRQHH